MDRKRTDSGGAAHSDRGIPFFAVIGLAVATLLFGLALGERRARVERIEVFRAVYDVGWKDGYSTGLHDVFGGVSSRPDE